MILNGDDFDYIEDKPFDYCFTKEKIKNYFAKLGYVPITRKALRNPNIRHEMNEKDGKAEDLFLLSKLYETTKNDLREKEFTVERVFDAKIYAAPVIWRRAEEKDQIDGLVAKKKSLLGFRYSHKHWDNVCHL